LHLHTSELQYVHSFYKLFGRPLAKGKSEHPSAPVEDYDEGNNLEGDKRSLVGFVKNSDYDCIMVVL
jgi:hypothetical protein